MAAWRVLFIVVLACACLGLVLATAVVAMTTGMGAARWAWFAGLLAASFVMGALFVLFLRSSDRAILLQDYRARSR